MGGRYDDSVRGDVTRTAPFRDRTSRSPTLSESLPRIQLISPNKEVGQIVPGRGCFRAVLTQNKGKFATPPLPHVEPARVRLHDTLRPAHYSFLTRCIGWQKYNRADNPILYLDTPIKTGSESIEATLRRRGILFAGFVARMKDTRLPKCVMFGKLMGGAGCVGGQEK